MSGAASQSRRLLHLLRRLALGLAKRLAVRFVSLVMGLLTRKCHHFIALCSAPVHTHTRVLQCPSVGIVKRTFSAALALQVKSSDSENSTRVGESHEGIMEMLLPCGADVDARGSLHGNALIVASSVGREDNVKVLLAHDADVNAERGYCGDALVMASVGGYENIVKILLAHGAHINAQGGIYDNALRWALERIR